MEVKKQVENALVVTVVKFGKMGTEKPKLALPSDTFAENVTTVLVNRQSYQYNKTILMVVKYAL